MVAMKRILSILVCWALFQPVATAQEQPKARIAGLESNPEYMSLLRDDVSMQQRMDSLQVVVDGMREKFVDNSGNRKKYSAEILRIEGEIYALRGEKSRLAKRINAIEQNWIMENMANGVAVEQTETSADTVMSQAAGVQYAELTRNAWFSNELSSEDYAVLRKAQKRESVVADLVDAYAACYDSLAMVRNEYAAADNEASADSLMSLFLTRQGRCNEISDSLASTWSYVFDNKTYLYDLLFDKQGRTDMLAQSEHNLFEMRRNIEKMEGLYASDAIVDYFFQKRYVVDYEIAVANAAGLQKAADSLAVVRKSIDGMRYRFDKLNFKRRYFLDYEPLKFSTKYVYNSKNPVPECTVYENGEIFRIKLGEFSARQPVSKFKGLEPVAYLRTPDGGWRYYAGGYRSVEELEKDLQTVKRLGFRSADVAAWIDGNYANSRAELEELMSKHFHIEITGAEELSPEVRRIIGQNAPDSEISRIGADVFVVNGFKSREAADLIARSVVSVDSSLKVTVGESGYGAE